jgi:hypothetical protein
MYASVSQFGLGLRPFQNCFFPKRGGHGVLSAVLDPPKAAPLSLLISFCLDVLCHHVPFFPCHPGTVHDTFSMMTLSFSSLACADLLRFLVQPRIL